MTSIRHAQTDEINEEESQMAATEIWPVTEDIVDAEPGAERVVTSPRSGRRNPAKPPPLRWLLRLGSLAIALGLWHLLTTNQVDLWLRFSRVPPPAEVLEALRVQLGAGLGTHVVSSMRRIVTGFVLAGVAGIGIGMLIARSPRFADAARPVLEVIRPIPAIAWVPLAILIFPTSEQGIVFITFLAAFFPVMVSTLHAVRALPAVWEQAALTMGARRRTIWSRVLLPGILPGVFSGLSVAMGVAWICVISAEMISGQFGVGYFTWRSYGLLDYPGVVVGMLTIGLLGWQSAVLIELTGRRLTRWLPSEERSR
jgi:NitT/TauT family transport system permease protein